MGQPGGWREQREGPSLVAGEATQRDGSQPSRSSVRPSPHGLIAALALDCRGDKSIAVAKATEDPLGESDSESDRCVHRRRLEKVR